MKIEEINTNYYILLGMSIVSVCMGGILYFILENGKKIPVHCIFDKVKKEFKAY